MVDKMTAHEIERCHRHIGSIGSLDETIKWIGEDIEARAKDWGIGVRGVFGRNRISQFTNEVLGQIVATSIINALLEERATYAAEIADLVDVSPPPCPKQKVDQAA